MTRIVKVEFPNEVPESEWSADFDQKAANAMGVSYFKYGALDKAYPHHANAIKSLKERIKKYEKTGNVEWLVDVRNFAMIEYMKPAHPKAHYRGTDAAESPGRVNRWTGKMTQASNDALRSEK